MSEHLIGIGIVVGLTVLGFIAKLIIDGVFRKLDRDQNEYLAQKAKVDNPRVVKTSGWTPELWAAHERVRTAAKARVEQRHLEETGEVINLDDPTYDTADFKMQDWLDLKRSESPDITDYADDLDWIDAMDEWEDGES